MTRTDEAQFYFIALLFQSSIFGFASIHFYASKFKENIHPLKTFCPKYRLREGTRIARHRNCIIQAFLYISLTGFYIEFTRRFLSPHHTEYYTAQLQLCAYYVVDVWLQILQRRVCRKSDSSRILTSHQPHRVTSGRMTHSFSLYTIQQHKSPNND